MYFWIFKWPCSEPNTNISLWCRDTQERWPWIAFIPLITMTVGLQHNNNSKSLLFRALNPLRKCCKWVLMSQGRGIAIIKRSSWKLLALLSVKCLGELCGIVVLIIMKIIWCVDTCFISGDWFLIKKVMNKDLFFLEVVAYTFSELCSVS